MMRQTGGSAVGWISTRSSPRSPAIVSASSRDRIPTCSPSAPMTRTRGTRISVFLRLAFSVAIGDSPVIYSSKFKKLLCILEFVLQLVGELGNLHRPQVLTRPCTHGDEPEFLFAIADHEKVRNLLQRVFAYFIADFLVAHIRLHAETLPDKGLRHFRGKFGLRIGDIHHHRLHRRQPRRELPGVMKSTCIVPSCQVRPIASLRWYSILGP